MLKNLIVLPDGTELFSGSNGSAIITLELTQAVNSEAELTLGSTCAAMVEATIFDGAGLQIAAGDELTVYKVDETGKRHKVGLFTAEKPARASANSISVTAYDRVSWLDKDLTQWLADLPQWPYTLYTFAQMVCTECGLTLINADIPNGDYPVQQFSADGITGRQLMQWIGQICGRFCRATADGDLEFAWYEPLSFRAIGATSKTEFYDPVSYDEGNLAIDLAAQTDSQGNVAVSSDFVQASDDEKGNVVLTTPETVETLFYYQGGLSYDEYTVAPIEKVQLRQGEEDVGTVWPDVAEEVNTYIISGNYLLTASTAEDLLPIAQTLYEQLKDVTYTPCKVSIQANLDIRPGHTVQITDMNGKTITAYVMTKTTSGQQSTLECTGSARRDSPSAVNNQSYKALSGKVLNLRTDVEGLKVEHKDTAGHVASLEMNMEQIRFEVAAQDAAAKGLQERMTSIEQTSEDVKITVQKFQDDGAKKVKTESGYSFTDEGLIISKTGEEMENKLDHTGMYVNRGDETILQANAYGVVATDVSVHNYLVVGDHARFEDYSDGTDNKRTACFWMEE